MWWPIVLILWIACSVLCYAIMKSKGYPNERCLKHGVGGFFLGFIWLIVVLLYSPANKQEVAKQETRNAIEELGRLARLKEQGEITDAEFVSKRAELLEQI